MSKEVGNRIKLLRNKKGLKQDELAAAIGVSPSAVSNYEQGTRVPKDDTLKALVTVLDTTSDYILMGTEPAAVSSSRPLFTQEDLLRFRSSMRELIIAEPVVFENISTSAIRDLTDDDLDILFNCVIDSISKPESKGE